MTDRMKQSWIIALVAFGWIFWLLPTAEDIPDAEPATPNEWKIWLAINIIALGAVHFYNVRIGRQWKQEARQAHERRISMQDHPTHNHYE